MASKYWIKLYHEILEDPKMGRLDDSTWRLAIECFLMAGEVDQDGLLGTTEDIAWKLRRSCNETLHELLRKLNACNILVLRDDNTWFVKKFKERQKAVSGAERVRQHRKRQVEKPGSSATSTKRGMATRNENVTKSYTDTDTDTDTDINNNEGGNQAPSDSQNLINSTLPEFPADPVYKSLCDYYKLRVSPTGQITRHVADRIKAELDEGTPQDWLEYALEAAADHEKYQWSYIQGILKKIEETGSVEKHKKEFENGHKSGSRKSKANGQAGGEESSTSLTDAYLENNEANINRKLDSLYRG